MARIDRKALAAFIEATCDRIENTPMPADISTLPGADGVPQAEWHLVWLSAGLATQIGDVLMESPEEFVIAVENTVIGAAS